jgi:membrane-bound lytic murein transglycosylase D
VIKGIFQSQGLPTSLIGVAAVESGFNPVALSPKGAAGLWQFMPGTARQYGLVVNANQDDRFDVLKSTVAAAKYLHALHDQFGDWPLALAAYNAGPNRVVHGIDRINARNFWALSRDFALPDETRDYVPKVLAAMRGEFTSQNVEPEDRTFWNRSGEIPRIHSMYPNPEGAVVFAITSPEALISQGGE